MSQVTLHLWSEGDTKELPLTVSRLTFGRGDQADVQLPDQGLSRIHASLNYEGRKLWVLDENSTNGTFVNGRKVSANGSLLSHGDKITLGDSTSIKINVAQVAAVISPVQAPHQSALNAQPAEGVSTWVISAAAVVVLALLVGIGVVIKIVITPRPTSSPATTVAVAPTLVDSPQPIVSPSHNDSPTFSSPLPMQPRDNVDHDTKIDETTESYLGNEQSLTGKKIDEARYESPNFDPNGRTKPYRQMTEAERVLYIHVKVQMVGEMVGNRPAIFPDEAIKVIKYWVDAYDRRIGSGNTRLWAEDLTFMFQRARTQFTPTIIKAFRANQAPVVVGVYIPVIETEYRNISSENFAGAAGLFQFLGPTARGYGVDPSERTNIEKMSHAAAKYIKERLGGFGSDAVGVGLSIAGYNRSPRSVARDLNTILNSIAISDEELSKINQGQNKDRDFWILVKEKARLDHWFQRENVQYVPRFFAAAIIGENPWDFGLKMKPLSTYSAPALD